MSDNMTLKEAAAKRNLLKEAIRKEIRKFLKEEEDLFGDEEPAAPEQEAPAAQSQQAPTDNKVSLGKVSGTADGAAPQQEEEISLEASIEKLNTIRSGRSFKDDEILAQMESYYNDLKDAEKKALQAFLTGISQIVTAGVEGTQAAEPEDPPANIAMTDKNATKSKQVKPNIIAKGNAAPSKKSAENTAAPVAAKQR